MKKFYAERQGDCFLFVGDEFAHFNVLRCSVGERVLCLGEGSEDYLCEVVEVSKKQAIAKIIETVPNVKNPKKNIAVFQGIVKGEKQELIVQKLTELGATSLCMFESDFTVAKGNMGKIDRLNKISIEACKQCGRNIPLKLHKTIKFDEVLGMLSNFDIVLFANEKDTKRTFKSTLLEGKNNIAIIVGSEGGFSDEEIFKINNAGAYAFGLGLRILRAETACIAMTSIVGYLSQN